MIITLDGKQTAKDLNSATSLRIESNSSLTLADSSSLSDGLQMASDTARLLQIAGTLKVHGETLALLLNGEISAPTVELSTTANSILSQSENGRIDTRQLSLDITNDATLLPMANCAASTGKRKRFPKGSLRCLTLCRLVLFYLMLPLG